MTEFLRPIGYNSRPAIGEKIRPPISNALLNMILSYTYIMMKETYSSVNSLCLCPTWVGIIVSTFIFVEWIAKNATRIHTSMRHLSLSS
jgi:hypothetical protein